MKTRLLVIDDEQSICDLVATVATDFGFDVTAMNDASSIDVDVLASFDYLVLDLLMPHIDGVQFLRRFSGQVRLPRLLLMSGLDRRTLESARQFAETKGIDVCDVLRKPFRPAELRAIFEKHYSQDSPVRPAASTKRAVPVITLPEIATAIEHDQLIVYFQPQVSLCDGRWCGVEALVRWQHPVHGLLYPDAFIALVENSALALPFTEAVIRSAIKGVKTLEATAGFEGHLSVNIPPTALTEVTIPERFDALLAEMDFDRKRFIVEITETSIPTNLEVSQDIQTRLSMRGIRMSIDDFGTGHSSLERLHGSPFSELKIDIAFVRRADEDPAARAIIRNAIALSKSLAMETVAEGIETAQTLAWLKSEDCDIGQGYFISRPQPVEILAGWKFVMPQLD